MEQRKSIPVLNMFNYYQMPLGNLELNKDYFEVINKVLKKNFNQNFLIGFVSKGEGKDFEIIGCSIVPEIAEQK